MDCRRCGKELPVGHEKTCPYCGIYLETIITPRNSGARVKPKPNRRATIMSFMSVALVVAVVCIVIPVMRNAQKQDMLVSMEEMFADWNGREAEFSEDDWKQNLIVFSGAVNNFRKSYPNDEENIELITRYLDILNGFDPDTGESTRPSEQELHDERLILRAKDEIFDIIDISFIPPDSGGRSTLTVQVRNSSNIFIGRVTMEIRIFDANGNPSNGSKRDDNNWYPNVGALLPGEEKTLSFREPWTDADAAGASVEWINIVYTDRDDCYFSPEVCKALWP